MHNLLIAFLLTCALVLPLAGQFDASKYTNYVIKARDKKIASALEAKLASKGFIRSDSPDFIVRCRIRSEAPDQTHSDSRWSDGNRLQELGLPGEVPDYYNGVPSGANTSVVVNQQKKISLLITDARTKKIIWKREKDILKIAHPAKESPYVSEQIAQMLQELPSKDSGSQPTAQPPNLSKYATYSVSNLDPKLAAKVDTCLASKGFIKRDPPDLLLSYVLAEEPRSKEPRQTSTTPSDMDAQASARVSQQLDLERAPVNPYPGFSRMIEKDSEPRKILTVKLIDAKTRKTVWSDEKEIPSNTHVPADSGYVRAQIVKLLKQVPAKSVR
jgi:hypothetical protein